MRRPPPDEPVPLYPPLKKGGIAERALAIVERDRGAVVRCWAYQDALRGLVPPHRGTTEKGVAVIEGRADRFRPVTARRRVPR